MIKNSEDANKYYQIVNQYIDEYTDNHKIRPVNLGKYLKNSDKLKNILERKGQKDIKNINQVISDVISDRIAMEKDLVKTFENFKFFESDEFKISNLKVCLYKGIEKVDLNMEKVLADVFDTNLSAIDVVDSDKHIFKVNDGVDVIVYSKEDLEIIKNNI